MPKILSAAIVLFAIGILPATALNARSFVSAHGSDSAACTLAAPCRTFAAAFAATNASGEIDVLDTAGYGPLTITKAISIINEGSIASVLVPSGGNGITINAAPNDAVSLRGLSIDGAGVGTNGILFNTGKSLTVENSTMRHLSSGIQFSPNASSNLLVSNSLMADNILDGILVAPSGSGTVTMVLNRVEANNNRDNGIVVFGNTGTTITATVSDSVAAGNLGSGISAFNLSPTTAPTTLTVVRSVSANNGTAIFANANGPGVTIRLANSTVTGNTAHGWLVSNAILGSYGDNYIDGNGPNLGSLTVVGKQ